MDRQKRGYQTLKRYTIKAQNSKAVIDPGGRWVRFDSIRSEFKRLKKFESLYLGMMTEFQLSRLFPDSSITGVTNANGDIITIIRQE